MKDTGKITCSGD